MENKEYRTIRIEGLKASIENNIIDLQPFELKIYDKECLLTVEALHNDNGIYDEVLNYFWDNVYPNIEDINIIDVDKKLEQNKNNMYLGLSNKYN